MPHRTLSEHQEAAYGTKVVLATRDLDGSVLHLKLDAIGFGFLVSIFFIASGMKLDVDALFDGGAGLKLTLGFFALIPLARASVFALYLKPLGARCAL
ncbi:MAG TPA: hypothetical protein VLC91_11420, partial [Spongiibacteraceae bacterium]|nr:hypothetical protein [Spongiibacteraceae bacterium]